MHTVYAYERIIPIFHRHAFARKRRESFKACGFADVQVRWLYQRPGGRRATLCRPVAESVNSPPESVKPSNCSASTAADVACPDFGSVRKHERRCQHPKSISVSGLPCCPTVKVNDQPLTVAVGYTPPPTADVACPDLNVCVSIH